MGENNNSYSSNNYGGNRYNQNQGNDSFKKSSNYRTNYNDY